MTLNFHLKSVLKMSFIMLTMGGSKIIQNRPFSTSGTRDPQNINFLKIRTFLQKLPEIGPQNRPPKLALLKMPFPTKTPVLFVQWRSKNVTFWGVGGRTARTEKCRHYYIAKTGFRGPKLTQIYRFFTPAKSALYW
jgi:hypothetical protein